MTDPMQDRLRALTAPTNPEAIDPHALARAGRRRRRSRLGVAAAVVVVAAAVAVPLAAVEARRGGAVAADGAIPGIPDAGERTLDGMPALACGVGPLADYVATPGAENADTPEARGLRQVIAADPSTGYAPPSPHGWVLLGKQGADVVFAQRVGAVGLGDTITLAPKGSAWVYGRSTFGPNCGPIGYADGTTVQPLRTYTADGDDLVLDYLGGSCDRRTPTVHVVEHTDSVDVLATLSPLPLTEVPCAGGGLEDHVTAHLAAPLGGRTVHDLAFVPSTPLLSAAAARASEAAADATYSAAIATCTAAASALHLTHYADAFPEAVATVLADVPASRTAWAALPTSTAAAFCSSDNSDGSRTTYVAAPGAPPLLIDDHATQNPFGPLP